MRKYIALLRGINVGGNNKIAMGELKAAFLRCGFLDVQTYINSGNVIFCSDTSHEEALKKKCEAVISDTFQLNIPVAVLSASHLCEALKKAPKWWDTIENAKHNAIFAIPPAAAKDIIEQVGPENPEYERIGYYGQVIFWSAPIKTFSRTKWSKIVGTSVYSRITIRNANTAKRLASLAEDKILKPGI